LVFGMLDLTIGLLRNQILSESARYGARRAIVHGTKCPASLNGGPWGPTAISTTASASGIPLVDQIKPLLVGFDLSQTTITAKWLDGGNAASQHVQVTVSTPYTPIMGFIFGNSTYTLTASSTMSVSH
jgi:hypothetical protein